VTGDNKLKIRASGKEFGKKEAIPERKKLSLLLLSLLLGGFIGVAGCYIAYELTKDRKPPLIKDLKCELTRIVNDKVYDINVSFSALDDKSHIASAELIFKPENYSYFITKYGMRPEDYNLVFPNDTRVIQIIPVDGSFNSTHEDFVVPIKNTTGGVEYRITAIVKDSAGNEGRAEIKTPYIREFENFGKQLYERGIIVSIVYYPFYPKPRSWNYDWDHYIVHPLMGKYNVSDPIVIAKQIDWATGYGINTFFLAYGSKSKSSEETSYQYQNILSLLNSSLIKDVRIAIQYEAIPEILKNTPNSDGIFYLSNRTQWEDVVTDFKKIKNILAHPNTLKIDNKPVVYIYSGASLYGNVEDFIKDLKGVTPMFLIGDHAHPWAAPAGEELLNVAKQWDGWTVWAAGWYTPIVKEPLDKNYPEFLLEGYNYWSNTAKVYGKLFMPSVIPGFVQVMRDEPKLPRNPDMFYRELKVADKTAYSPYGFQIIKVDTFNDFGESTAIEPTREEGFIFSKKIKESLKVLQITAKKHA
jgi:hypothetical protein